jgi:hypothetical protein
MSEDQAASDIRALVDFLRDRDAWCPACRYNLRGLTTPRCPECGRELRLSVGATEPFLRAWIMLAVAACSAAGVGVLFGWIVIAFGFPYNGYRPREAILLGVIAFFMVMVLVAPLVLITRWRFLKLSQSAQWRIAGVVTVVTAVAFLLLLATIH